MGKTFNARPTTPEARPTKTLGGTSAPGVVANPAVNTVSANTVTTGHVSNAASGADVNDFVKILRGIVEPFAIVDDDVLTKNVQLAGGYGMSAEDRTITFECAEYTISNMAYIIMGLVLDKAFKSTFIEAVNVEIELDNKDEATRKQVRESMKDPKPYQSIGSIVIGLTGFTPAVEADFMTKMEAGFDSLDAYADEFDAAVDNMTVQEKTECGFIASNFMYLIRAFTHNDLFMAYVITVIEKVKARLKRS